MKDMYECLIFAFGSIFVILLIISIENNLKEPNVIHVKEDNLKGNNMKTTIVYAIMRNTDSIEGRGPLEETGIYFKNRGDAIRFAGSDRYKKFAVMGYVSSEYADRYVQEKEILTFDGLTDYDNNLKQMEIEERLEKIKSVLSIEDMIFLQGYEGEIK